MGASVFAGAAFWDKAASGTRTQGLFGLDAGSGEWHSVTGGLPDPVEVRCIARRDADTIYVGTQVGPYRSMDGGRSWRLLELPGSPGPDTVVWSILPLDDGGLLVGTQGTLIYRSDDEGASWRLLDVPLPTGAVQMGFPLRVIRLTADPSNPKEIYAGLEVGGVVRSLDGGETWSDISAGLMEYVEQDEFKSRIGTDQDQEGMMDTHSIAISPVRPGTVFLANRMGLFRSPDKGDSWEFMDVGRFSPLTYARDVIVSPHDPNTLFAALSIAALSDEGSLYRSTDLGETWTRFDKGVSMESTLMNIGPSPSSPDRVYCAARQGQVFGTEDGGATWRTLPLPAGVSGVYAVDSA
jgi:photosystem II stability/assembly factor-like uncharacterized protein